MGEQGTEDIIKPKRESKQINRPTSVDFLDGLMDYIDEEEFEVRYFLTCLSNSSPSFSMVSMALEKSINEMFFPSRILV